MWPLATPPMAGLHDIFAVSVTCTVRSAVASPMRAHAWAASHPAWPAPTTTTSKRPSRVAAPCADAGNASRGAPGEGA